MPQSPYVALVGKNPSNKPVQLNTDANGTLAIVNDSSGDPAVPAMDSAGNIKILLSVHNSSNAATVLTENADGGIPVHLVNDPTSGWSSTKNITVATAVKASAGFVGVATVVVAGSGLGTINDCATTGAAAASNAIASLDDSAPNTVPLNFPCGTGIVVVPGTGQTIAISWK